MRRTRRIALLLLTGLAAMLLLVGCGGGDDDGDTATEQTAAAQTAEDEDTGASAADAPASEGEGEDAGTDADVSVPSDLSGYEAELRTIVEDVERELDEAGANFQSAFFSALGDVDLSDEDAVNDVLAEVFREFLPAVLKIAEGGIDRLEALDPPGRYADDHAAFVRAVREIADLQDEATALLDDPVGAEAAFDDLDRRQTEIEERLRAEVSPEFAALIDPFFTAYEDDPLFTGDDADTGLGFGGDESADGGGDSAFTFGGDLPESFPDVLVPPDADLLFADSQTVDGRTETIGSWTSTAAAEDLLDFYEGAIAALGLEGDVNRLEFGEFRSLELTSPDGEVLAGVVISPGGAEGELAVLVTVTQ